MQHASQGAGIGVDGQVGEMVQPGCAVAHESGYAAERVPAHLGAAPVGIEDHHLRLMVRLPARQDQHDAVCADPSVPVTQSLGLRGADAVA
jgi:hypothetical protein